MSSILTDDIININTNNLNDRVSYGNNNEIIFLKILKNINTDFKKIQYVYSKLDYVLTYTNNKNTGGCPDERSFGQPPNNIYIELKTRTITINKFNTTIFPVGKLEYFNSLGKNNELYICYGFIDDIDNKIINFYFIKYNKTIFSTFNITTIFNKIHFEIPINLLQPFKYFNI